MNVQKLLYILFLFTLFIAIIFSITSYLNSVNISLYRDKYLNHNLITPLYIPKKIFQTIPDKTKISKDFQDNINKLKQNNPDWQYFLFDDNDINQYLNKYYPNILPYYNKINPKYGASRADFFRYLLMYREGGVYLDIKSFSELPLSQIILPDDEFIFTTWSCPCQTDEVNDVNGEFQQWHVICKPNHPLLLSVIKKVINNIDDYSIDKYGVGKQGVIRVTGPIAYTKAIKKEIQENKKNLKYRIIYSSEYIGLIYNNLKKSHVNLFSKTHYSKINEPIIL
jgi:mannosyltransferase OCH1-like enzyme